LLPIVPCGVYITTTGGMPTRAAVSSEAVTMHRPHSASPFSQYRSGVEAVAVAAPVHGSRIGPPYDCGIPAAMVAAISD
jgi:hypothetical protein